MRIDGGCHCGAVTYTAEADPEAMSLCHCTDCQRMSGTAFRMVLRVPEGGFRQTGETKTYVKIADSGNRRAMEFCPECGTQLYATDADAPAGDRQFGLRVGTCNQRAELVPRREGFRQSALPWVSEFART